MTRPAAVVLAAAVAAALPGCGSDPPTYPAGGRVVFTDGSPVKTGAVEFAPADGGPAARAAIGKDGRFTLATGARPGGVAGPHRIAVVQLVLLEGVSPKDRAAHSRERAWKVVDRKYARFDTSGLTREVVSGAENDFVIEVEDGK